MTSTFDLFCKAATPTMIEHVRVPARAARLGPVPAAFSTPALGAWLQNILGGNALWRHQSLAMDKIGTSANLVISTGTGSGKSLVFQAAAMRAYFEYGGRSIILYPQKALAGDQLQRWKNCLEAASLSPDLVGEINGDIDQAEREAVLERCAIILATEDVLHAWLMRNVPAPATQKLLRSLSCLVIDEAHALEGVFGTSSAYFLRRLRSAALSARARTDNNDLPLQIVAATATIADPVKHLSLLTGSEFEAVTEVDNGAPFHGMDLLHIEGPEYGAPAEKMLADILSNLAGTIAPNAAIAFVDGRQAAERIAVRIGHDEVACYRSGYKRDERRDIEDRMRNGTLRAVVSTSALELGIDIPGFTVGLTVGVPQSRKALRQRIGRAGRAQRSVFAVIAPSTAFTKLGTTFADYAQGRVEPSPLYLDNHIIQFQQAFCLLDEIAAIGGKVSLPDNVTWPNGFAAMLEAAQPGAPRPRDLDQIALRANDSPHTSFSLRHIGDVQYRLRGVRGAHDNIGTIDFEKALREAYPGATYLHNKMKYRVLDWHSSPYERSIILRRATAAADTRPMINMVVGVSHAPDAIMDGRLRGSDQGSIAELGMRVVESVEGYTIGGKPLPYRELRKTERAMCRKQREFDTTGILIRVSERWFAGSGDAQRAARRALGTALVEMLARDRCIASSELRFASCGIAMHGPAGAIKIEDALALFDTIPGGLRLTAPLFDEIGAYLDRFSKAADLAGADAMLSRTLVDQLIGWEATLEQCSPNQPRAVEVDTEERVIFAPNSEVAVLVRGELHNRRLIEPQLMWVDDEERFGYRYEAAPGVSAWIPHDKVRSIGADWRHVIWNARSGVIRDIAA